MPRQLTFCLVIALAGFVGFSPAHAGEGLTFEKDVRPIFKAYCLDCHGAGEALKGPPRPAIDERFAEGGRQERTGDCRGSARGESARRAA